MLAGAEAQTIHSDDEGRFALEELPASEYELRISREGYVSETFAATIPHRGALRGVRVDLIPIRVRILEIYRVAALPLLPKPRHWARWTPVTCYGICGNCAAASATSRRCRGC